MHEMISFFDLPREVRDQILLHYCGNKLVATSKKQRTSRQLGRLIKWMPEKKSEFSHRDSPRCFEDTPALLCTFKVSRHFYNEAATTFYSTSRFHFQDLVPFYLLVDKLPIGYQSLIQELHLNMSAKEVDQWRAMLGVKATYLSGLRDVRIGIEIGTFTRPKFSEPVIFRLESSITLSSLRDTTVSVQYRYAEHCRDAVPGEDAEGIAQGLIDSLREGIECQESEKIG